VVAPHRYTDRIFLRDVLGLMTNWWLWLISYLRLLLLYYNTSIASAFCFRFLEATAAPIYTGI
jgi:hypothetical protein